MATAGVDTVLLSVGSDLPYLTGYRAMPLERLTMLVLPMAGDPVLVIPELEVARVVPDEAFTVQPWKETEDPIAIVARLAAGSRLAVGGRLPTRLSAFGPQPMRPTRSWLGWPTRRSREGPNGPWPERSPN